MRKLFTAALATALVVTLVSGPVWTRSKWDFQLYHTHAINGTQLEPGSYQLRLNGGNEAEIYRNRKLVAKAAVEVRPLKNGAEDPRSILAEHGTILEIRMKKEVVVFLATQVPEIGTVVQKKTG